MYSFDQVIQSKINDLTSYNTKSIEDDYINSVLYIDFQVEELMNDFNQVIYNNSVPHLDDFRED